MRIVVTGGTGFIGGALVPALREAGHEVVLTSRTPKGPHEIAWTPTEEGPWVEEVTSADAIFHLAGAGVADARWSETRKKELRDSRIIPAEIMARAIAKAPKKKPSVLVSGSAIGIYGFFDEGPECDESSPFGTDFLARLCVDWEKAAEPARAAGVRLVTARIGVVFGKGGPLAKMVQPFKAMAGGPLGGGRQVISWIHMRDAVRAFLFLLDGKVEGPFNIVSPHPATSSELATAIGKAVHRPSILRTPAFAIELALGAERAQIVLKGQRVIPTRLLGAGFEFSFPTLDVALANLL